jgi:repressor LexA
VLTEEESVDINKMSSRVSGKCISDLTVPENGQLVIRFVDGSALVVERCPGDLAIHFASDYDNRSSECAASVQPTSRQQDYLEFIKKYMARFGVAPAESDIQRHFLVSAPSVNQMMQALERHGFIIRQRRVARSIRLVERTKCAVCGGTHYLKSTSTLEA